MQTRKGSLLEMLLNQASGVLVALAVWQWVVSPLYQVEKPLNEGLSITLIFATVSVVRGYLWRRLFNYLHD